jgi:type I restriction enzyme, S subunit
MNVVSQPILPTDSGIPWIGKTPKHWKVCELRRKWQVIDCKHKTPEYIDDGYPLVSTTEVKPGKIDLSVITRYIAEKDFLDMTENRLPKRGDIIYSRNASLGSAAYVDTDEVFAMGQDVVLIISKNQDQLFLSYYLNAKPGMTQVDLACVGSTFRRINVGQIKQIIVSVPPLEEQKAIAQFLDRKTAAIDALIAKKQRLIELLEEKRSALINQAVTKGLNPDAPMKDSGIPWIGKIPQHWTVSKPKYLSRKIVDGTHVTPEYVDEGIPFLTVKNLTAGVNISFDETKFITLKAHQELCKRAKPEIGDLLVTKDGTLGVVRVIEEDRDFSIFVSLALIKPLHSKVDSYYFRYVLESKTVSDQFQARKIGSALKHIHLVELANIDAPLPPLEEQKEIAAKVREQLNHFHATEERISYQITKLREYRQSVITAAVTGKLDVTQEVAP